MSYINARLAESQTFEDIVDQLREEGCPEDELQDTALQLLSEQGNDTEDPDDTWDGDNYF